jgi:glycogen debranching enzyme
MAIFGRDALITALQTLALDPALARGALRTLAEHQARDDDPFRDAEPGKIPHEIRHGPLARCGRLPYGRYYGSADATPLFLLALGEAVRWTGDLELARELLPAAEAALAWIDLFGDRDGDGFVEYERRSSGGLEHQGWKDSHDAVCFADGRPARGPIALCEVQGYVYAAKRAMARVYRRLGQAEPAGRLRAEAAALRERFNERFWLPEQGVFALGLDGEKRPIDAVASNAGQCLWAGIAKPDRAARLARRLLAEDLFSGWGVRTLSTRMAAYNPLSYHNGSVWPHDNALIAAGLARYGHAPEADAIIRAQLEAAAHFPEYRLPELFAGFPRGCGGFPVAYPRANAPQAWAAGAVILLAQTWLGLRPTRDGLRARPLPGAPRSHWRGLSFRGERVEILTTGTSARAGS